MPSRILQLISGEITIGDIIEEIKEVGDPPDIERKAIEDFMLKIARARNLLREYCFPLLQRHQVLQLGEGLEIQARRQELKSIIPKIVTQDLSLSSILVAQIELLSETRKR